ncbi:hypothetical protein GQ457_01G018560 [Hibiscus cannabinus]
MEFYAHSPNPNNPRIFIGGQQMPMDVVKINSYFDIHIDEDNHHKFVDDLTTTDYKGIKDELCVKGTHWNTDKHRGTVNRRLIHPEAKLWKTFVKHCIMHTSYNTIVDKPRLELIHSKIYNRTINIGAIICNKIFEHNLKYNGRL